MKSIKNAAITYLFVCFLICIFLSNIEAQAESSYRSYKEINPLSEERVELIGPNVVGEVGLRGYRYGIVNVFFSQDAERYRYKWFKDEGQRVWLVTKIAEAVYKIPYDILKKAKPGDINFVILPPEMEKISYMGGEPWFEHMFGRANMARMEFREIFFVNWDGSNDLIELIIFHEMAHLLRGRQYSENIIEDKDVDRNELLADVSAYVWHMIGNNKTDTPQNKSEYVKYFLSEVKRQKPLSIYKIQPDKESSAIVKEITDRENILKGRNLDRSIWATEAGVIPTDWYKAYNFAVQFEISDGTYINYLANSENLRYVRFDEKLQRTLIFENLGIKELNIADSVYKNILNSQEELSYFLMLNKLKIMPMKIEIFKNGYRLWFDVPISHKNWGNYKLRFAYYITETSYSLITDIKDIEVPKDEILGI